MQKKHIFIFLGFGAFVALSFVVYVVIAKKVNSPKITEVAPALEKLIVPQAINDWVASVSSSDPKKDDTIVETSTYPLHRNITATYFWAGEDAGKDNKDISNLSSAWDDSWAKHYGGIDDPKKRSGFLPSGFTPKENPFYFALPYNDFDKKGKRKKEVFNLATWANSGTWKSDESILKNRWIRIVKGTKTTYAQWEDVGPFSEDDTAYVFGAADPKSKTNKHAGLDVSPAVRDMLGLSDVDTVDWQFVDDDQVPDGPWKKIVTTSQVYWK
jgi:hypothetical protein